MSKKKIFLLGIALLIGIMLTGCVGYVGYGYYDYPYGYGYYGDHRHHGNPHYHGRGYHRQYDEDWRRNY